MAIAGTRARLVTFEPTGPITARNVQDAVVEAAGGGGGGGGGGGLSIASVTLDHAQILDLATTPVTVVAAAGAGTAIVPTFAVYVKSGGGGYGSEGGNVTLVLDAANNYNQMTMGVLSNYLLGPAGHIIAVDAIPALQVTGVGVASGDPLILTSAPTLWGPVGNGFENTALSVSLQSGSLAGGDAGDTLKVTVGYITVDVS